MEIAIEVEELIKQELKRLDIRKMVIDAVRSELEHLVKNSGVIDLIIRNRIEKIVLAEIDTKLKISTKVEYL
jgi:hypothetical protein